MKTPDITEPDLQALQAVFESFGRVTVVKISHYVYFNTASQTESAATIIRQNAYQVEVRRAALGGQWLVLAVQRAIPTEALIAKSRVDLSAIATDFSGEYDGWEASLDFHGGESP